MVKLWYNKLYMKVILASASPRRVLLLKEIINDFSVQASDIDEDCNLLSPKKYVGFLARQKAIDVFNKNHGDRLVIGSDTIVVLDKKIIGKPTDNEDAKNMLRCLSGRIHKVYTGVCLISNARQKTFVVKSYVKFYKLTEKQIEQYINSGKANDKAGAYGIQDSGFVKKIFGSYSCVMGLPVEKLKKEIKRFLK